VESKWIHKKLFRLFLTFWYRAPKGVSAKNKDLASKKGGVFHAGINSKMTKTAPVGAVLHRFESWGFPCGFECPKKETPFLFRFSESPLTVLIGGCIPLKTGFEWVLPRSKPVFLAILRALCFLGTHACAPLFSPHRKPHPTPVPKGGVRHDLA
jgi:hypothetical protein